MPIERSRAVPEFRANRDRGASSLEYGALIAVAALVVGVLGTLVSTKVEGHVNDAICNLFQARCPDTGQLAGEEGGPGPLPSPSPGPPVPQPPPPKPSKEQTETEAVLNETQLGRDALKWVKDHGVRVVYRAGGGSYYDGDANVFYVDTN